MQSALTTTAGRRTVLACLASLVALSSLEAQPAPQQYVTLIYRKTEPGKAAEYRKFLETGWKKFAQAGVDDGSLKGGMVLRLTAPYVTGAPFDYVTASFPAGRPSVAPLLSPEMEARAKKAGFAGAQQYVDAHAALAKAVKSEWLTTNMRIGSIQAGNYMRTVRYATDWEDRNALMDFLREFTLPINAARLKDGGSLVGFGVHSPAMVSIEEAGYAASVSFIVKDAEAAMSGPGPMTEEQLRKAVPGRTYAGYLNRLNEMNRKRKPVVTRIYEVVATVGVMPAVTPAP
jgi:hypothetical protein